MSGQEMIDFMARERVAEGSHVGLAIQTPAWQAHRIPPAASCIGLNQGPICRPRPASRGADPVVSNIPNLIDETLLNVLGLKFKDATES
jgi:hypothetical protein